MDSLGSPQAGPHWIVSLLVRKAAGELGLELGTLAVAAVKATSVSVEIPASGTSTAGNFQQKSIWMG